MVSNLSTIGFDFDDDEAFRAAMAKLADEATERMTTATGEYAVWRSRTGAEIWFHLAAETDDETGERAIIGLTPFFEGHSDIPVEIGDRIERPDDNAMEGAFSAWVAPDDLGLGAYPIVFDAVDFAAHTDRELPDVWRARIAGFARDLKAYPDEAAFLAASDGAGMGLSAQSFIPVGLFNEDEDGDTDDEAGTMPAADEGELELSDAPQSYAILTGRVAEHVRHINEATGKPFHWLLVESLAATYDVLADPEAVTGDITVGGTVEVACLLFGRILEE